MHQLNKSAFSMSLALAFGLVMGAGQALAGAKPDQVHRLSEDLTKKAQDYAVRAHQALKCRGYSRTDMIVSDNEAYILETNTIPGMTATSLYPQAAAAAGFGFSELLDRLIELALEKD